MGRVGAGRDQVMATTGQKGGEIVKIADIAKRQAIPQKFLELILASLKQGGFVESRRGADGGYRLAKAANEITVGEVLRHAGETKKSRKGPAGPFTAMWKTIDESVSAVLDHTSFADLAKQWKESQSRYVPNWDI